MYMLMINKNIIADSIESEKEALDKAFELSKNGQKVEVIKKLGEVVYEPHFKKVTPKKSKESKEVSKDDVSTEEIKIILPKNEPSRVSNELETPVNPPSFTLEHNAFLDNIPTLSGLRATTSDMRKSLEALFEKSLNNLPVQEPKNFISDNEIDARIALSDAPIDSLAYKAHKLLIEKESKEVLSGNELIDDKLKVETSEIKPIKERKRKKEVDQASQDRAFWNLREVPNENNVEKKENIIHADIASKTDDIQKVVTIAIDKDSIKVIDVEDAIQEPISNPEIKLDELTSLDLSPLENSTVNLAKYQSLVEKQIDLKSKDIVSEPVKEVLNTEVENVEVLETIKDGDLDAVDSHFNSETNKEVLNPENKPSEVTPVEIKVLPEQEKTYICYIGATSFPMLETNLKKQCETKFKETLEKEAPLEALKNEKTTLMNWYKDTKLQDLDWFQHLYTKYIALASKKTVENTCQTSDVISTDPLEELLREFEHRLKNANFDQGVTQIIINDTKYTELQIKKKDQFNELKSYYQSESVILDLVDALRNKDINDPESFVKKYSPKTQKDQRVIDALESRKKADIEKLQKLNEVKKEVEAIQEKHNPIDEVKNLTDVELAIKEVNESTKETFPEVTNKYKELYLTSNDYYEAVKTKEKSFNIDLFNELLKELEGKSDIEVLRITSQVKYTYLSNILKDEWDKHITPITHRVQVKELCDELIKTPLTKQKDLLNKYPKEVQEDSNVLETLSNIRTAF